jgi:hypothetical protein
VVVTGATANVTVQGDGAAVPYGMPFTVRGTGITPRMRRPSRDHETLDAGTAHPPNAGTVARALWWSHGTLANAC